ncbi:MAG: long-chain fatty acid--CoA ligase [Chloroflexi bacterium]|nr:long-chain fatty acid--CoA ligase [Chloroflexota bacterium]
MADTRWLQHYDPGVAPSLIPYPQVPLHHFLVETAREFPDRPCTIFKGASLTYSQIDRLSDRFAAGLTALGVRRGDRVVIFMPNTPQFVFTFYGILKAGGAVVATNPLYSAREIEHQLADSGAEFAVVMSNFYSRIKEVQPSTSLKKVVVTKIKEYLPPALSLAFTLTQEQKEGHRVPLADGDVWLKDVLSGVKAQARPKVDVGPDDVALFQYSGGTTGLAKAAIALHRNLVANTLQIRAWTPGTKEGTAITLMAIPLFHVYGLVAGLSHSINIGSTLVLIPNPRDLPDVLGHIKQYRPTIFPGVPTMFNALNNHPGVIAGKFDLSSIQVCLSGSAPLLLDTKTRFEALTHGKLFEGYGLSEAPTATHCNPLMGKNKEGSIGLPLPDVECKLVSLDDGVTELAQGEIGEIVVRGPQVMKGYWHMPTETANTLRDMGDGGGAWLFTGDIGRMDDEGYFYIVDRKKELIKAGGFQVWPREIEEVIAAHPKVLEVGVAGVPDAHRGETAKAWIVPRPGEALTEQEIKDWCQDKLAKFKIPTLIEFRSELPKTTVGKVLRRELVREHKEKVRT